VSPQERGKQTERQLRSEDAAQEVRLVRSVDLFQGDREIKIEHAGSAYRLRITKTGKLILYK